MASPLMRLRRRLTGQSAPVIPAVRLAGTISAGGGFSRGLNLAGVENALERAFKVKKAPFVALLINSPGGSAAQSHLIFRRIRDLAERHETRAIAFCEDVAASGGYMIACAADEIVADPNSIVGSIGVIAKSFGFQELLGRYGVERRVYAAGGSKDFLDPFLPEREDQAEHLRRLQGEVHAHFIDLVKTRRGKTLDTEAEGLFEGLFWSGLGAKPLGLVDTLGDLRSVVRERHGPDAEIRLVAPPRKPLWRRLTDSAAEAAVAGTIETLEDRALWARYGL